MRVSLDAVALLGRVAPLRPSHLSHLYHLACSPWCVHPQATLEDLRTDCESKKNDAEYLFDGRWPIIGWHRVFDFQLLSLKLIAQAAVHAMPPYQGPQPPRVYIPNEISRQKLIFRHLVVLYVSAANPGAASMADELETVFGTGGLKLSHQRPEEFQVMDGAGEGAVGRRPSIPAAMAKSESHAKTATHMLLYLNIDTFVGEVGETLAREVRQARANALPIVLVHEVDTRRRRGCAFDRFFQTTPQDLLDDGLYRKIAVPCHPGAHRHVSLALVAKQCGAAGRRAGRRTAAADAVRSVTKAATRSRPRPVKALVVQPQTEVSATPGTQSCSI